MIKIVAFISMFIDHIALTFFPGIMMFKIIGRLSFPLFAWGIARGYSITQDYNKYLLRLIIFSITSQIPYALLFENNRFNIGFTLTVGLIIIKVMNLKILKLSKWILIIILMIVAQVARFEYGIYGILTILLFYMFGEKEYVILFQGILTLISVALFKYDPIQLFAVFAPLLIMVFKDNDIKLNKGFQYSIYPAHLLLLVLIRGVT